MAESTFSSVPGGILRALAILLVVLVSFLVVERAAQAVNGWRGVRHWQPPAPTGDMISVSGTGKVTAPPDIGLVQLAVETRAATSTEALNDSAKKMREIQTYVQGLGIEAKDLKTHSFNLYPNQTYNPQTGRQSIDGYVLSQGLEIKVRNLELVSKVLGGSIERGANQVGQLSFTIDDPEKLLQQARLEAIAEARAKAQALAAATGVRLGRVRSFTEDGQPWNPPMPMYSMQKDAAQGGGVEMPEVQPGSQEVQATVTIGFEIL